MIALSVSSVFESSEVHKDSQVRFTICLATHYHNSIASWFCYFAQSETVELRSLNHRHQWQISSYDVRNMSKSGQIDLSAYNIAIVYEDVPTFFGIKSHLPLPKIEPVILNNVEIPPEPILQIQSTLLSLSRRCSCDGNVCTSDPSREAGVSEFITYRLDLVGYDPANRVIHHQMY